MKNIISSLSLVILLIHSSCSHDAKGSADTSESNSEKVSSNADCVFDYLDKYDQLLSLETIKKHFKGDLSSAKMKYNKSTDPKKQKQDSYLYQWKGERTKTIEIGGQKITVPLDNEIGIKWLGDDLYKIMNKETSIASFKAFYHTPTKDELDAAFQKTEEKLDGDKSIKEETKTSAMGMAKDLAAGAKYVDVAGLGDAASWDVRDNALIILIGTKTFKIVANVSADSDANKTLALQLAKEVLAVCQ